MDFLNSQFIINYVRESPPENYKMLSAVKKQSALSYESGEKTLQVGEMDVPLVKESTNIYLVADKPVDLTINTGTVLPDMEQFAYSGKHKISISVTSKHPVPVLVRYAAGNVLMK